MKTKIASWRLITGTKDGQETRDQKILEGMKYVEMLRKEHNVLQVLLEKDQIKIIMEDK
jgi:hypothetical protein